MIAPACTHPLVKKHGHDRRGNPRFRCKLCGKTWVEVQPKPLGEMRITTEDAKLALRLLVEGMSIRATERTTGLHRDTICRLLVRFGHACQRLLDERMRKLTLTHLEFDEQWTYVAKKQSRLTTIEREESSDKGDVYLWTCVDQKTKLMPSFRIGKRSADNARRFMLDVASRLVFPKPHASDDHAFAIGHAQPIVQISTDGFSAYPEAVDLAFGPYAKFGTIIKEYRNANIVYQPSEMVGTKRTGRRGIGKDEEGTICTSHVERLNGTQRVFMKRLNRLTLCFSKKLANLAAAFAMYAAYYNFCWRPRKPGKTGRKRPTAAMMAGLTDRVWTFDELFAAALEPATHN
jgi:transposase-like protein/IS1 family transposase